MRGTQSIDVIVPVYNGGDAIAGTLERLLGLLDTTPDDIRIIVCNDGSSDDTAQRLDMLQDERLRCITLEKNRGRSGARNAAVAASDARYLLFMDADCRPRNDDYFVRLLALVRDDVILAYGPIEPGPGNDTFWRRYLDQVQRRRDAAAGRGEHLQAMATGNLLLRRDLFDEAGGFCEAYRHYGFEDRDLVACLLGLGLEPHFERHAAVSHQAGYTVAGYCRRMRDAAAFSATIFSQRHPQAYRQLSYARLDPDLRAAPVGGTMRLLGKHTADYATRVAGDLVGKRRLPWRLRLLALQIAAALSFLAGAAQRR